VETGRGLADALRGDQEFPPILVYMVAAGERSGRLADMFERAADHLESDVDGAVSTGLSLLEPGIIIVMAAGGGDHRPVHPAAHHSAQHRSDVVSGYQEGDPSWRSNV
jgi:hypothetical protein